jgi:hypothetical protein
MVVKGVVEGIEVANLNESGFWLDRLGRYCI